MTTPSKPLSAVDEAACAWASRLDAGLPARDRAALDAWLARDPAHAWRLEHFRQFYAKLHGTVPALLAEGRVRLPPPATRRRRAWRRAAGLAAAAVLAIGAYRFIPRAQEFATIVGEHRVVTLDDGSTLDLNARTALSVRLGRAERRVRLAQGEAYFEVAKDRAHPFFVETPAGTVRVTGTRFNIRTTGTGELEVTVLEGSVAVATGPGETWSLQPHEQVSVAGGLASQRRLGAAATENVVAWREGKIVFDETPLADALGRFAAYHGRTLTVAPEVAGLPLGGRYTLADLDPFVAAVEKMLPVRALRGEHGAVRFVPAPSGAK